MQKNKKNIFFVCLFFIVLSFLVVINNTSYSATNYKYYSKSQMQNFIVSTAYSYLNNKRFSEYDQKTMEEGALGSKGTATSMNWRNFNVTPEGVSRANYYHVDCSTFAALVYMHSLNYDFSSFYTLSTAVYYKFSAEDSKFKSYDISAYKDKLRFTNGYKYYGKSISTAFYQNIGESKNSVDGKEYKNNSSTTTDIVVYHHNFNGDEYTDSAKTKIKESIESILQPGDIINYRREVSGDVNGHAMVYVGTLFDNNGGFIHSTGSDYVVENSTLKSIGDDDNSVRYDGMYRLYNNIFNKSKPTVSVTILRPINSFYDSSTKKYKVDMNSVNSNISARVQLKGLRTEQYSRTYNVTLNGNVNNNVKENLWSASKYNSVNIGDEILYNLYLENTSEFGYCDGNALYNSESACKKNSTSSSPLTWKVSTKNSKTFENIIITAQIPSNTTYVECTGDYKCTYNKSNNTLSWTITKLAATKSTSIRYKVKVNSGTSVSFNGFNVKNGSSGSVLNMDSIVNNVNPTIGKINAEVFRSEIKKFKTLAEATNPTIKYTTGDSNYKIDLDNPKTANISGYGFHKSIYYNAMGIDLGYLSGTNIRDAIFNRDSNYNYAKKTEEQITQLTNENYKKINKMLVKGFYGGRHLHGNDNRDRTGRLRLTDLEFGDLIVYYTKSDGKNAGTSTMLMYLGTDTNSDSTIVDNSDNSYFVRFTSDNKVTLYTIKTSKKPYMIFNELYSKDLFVVLRPTQLYGTTVNYVGATVNGESLSVEYGTYKNLNKPTSSNKYNLTLNYIKSNYSCNGCKTTYTGSRTFDNWYKENSYTNKISNGSKLVSTSKHNLYAKWNYTSIVLPSATVPGYSLEGWCKEKACTNKVGNAGSNYSLKSTSETLYAKWKANTYSVKYNSNGGKGTMNNSTHTYDKSSNLNISTYYKDGYVFAGWSTTSSGSVVYLDGASVKNLTTGTGVVNLYAVWREREENEFEVIVNVKNGYSDANKKIVLKGKNVSFVVNSNTVYDSGVVDCSNGKLNGSTLTINNVQKSITCNVTYSPIKYTVRYDSNGGIGSLKDTTHTYGVNGSLAQNSFVKDGYNFVGWSRKTGTIVDYKDKDEVINLTSKREVVVLYAVWKPITYTIKYDLKGGTLNNSRNTYNVESNTFNLGTPFKKGYSFIGWTGSNGESPQMNVSIQKGTIGDKKYIANYETGKFKVVYLSDKYGSITGIKEETLKYKENPSGTTYVSNSNYKFLKFSVNKDVVLVDGTKIMKHAPITMEQIKNIVIEEDIIITLYHYDVKYTITYNNGENGEISGILSEEVALNSNPLGTEVTANLGYEFKYWLSDKNVELLNGEVIIAGSPIFNINNIVIKDNLILTPVFEVGSYNVTYLGSDYIIITGKTNEVVIYPNKLGGTTYNILNSNYKFGYWTSDVDVLLDNEETIKAGNPISDEELKSIIVTSDMVLTANTKMTYYTVYYKCEKGIMIVNDTMEIVYDGQGIKGVKYINSKSLNKIVYVSNLDVLLKDGTIIKAGNEITESQLQEIVLGEDITLTLCHEKKPEKVTKNDNNFVVYACIIIFVLLLLVFIVEGIKKSR